MNLLFPNEKYGVEAIDFLFLFLFLEAFILFIYYICLSYKRSGLLKLQNPNIYFLEWIFSYTQETETMYKSQYVGKIKAQIDGVNSLQVGFIWTGSENDYRANAYEIKPQGGKIELGIARVHPKDKSMRTNDTFAIIFHNMVKGEEKSVEINFTALSDKKNINLPELFFVPASNFEKIILKVSFLYKKIFEKNILDISFPKVCSVKGYPKFLEGESENKSATWNVSEERKIRHGEEYYITWTDI